MKKKPHLDSVYGTVLRSRVVAKFTLTETSYAAGLRLPKHSHHHNYFCFVLQGSFTECYEKQSRACKPSTLVFHPLEERHSDYFHTAARCFNLLIDARWLDCVRQHSTLVEGGTDFHGGIFAQLATRLYKEFRQFDELSPLIVEGLTSEVLGEAARYSLRRREPAPPPWLEQARELLHDQFHEHLTLSQVARAVGVHETHLSREFRHHYRTTVGEYIRRLRIEFACHSLSTSSTPLIEVALAAGFADQSHFARTFKLQTGMSPATYRRTLGFAKQIQNR
jgi:AraC family transcriptional regulator